MDKTFGAVCVTVAWPDTTFAPCGKALLATGGVCACNCSPNKAKHETKVVWRWTCFMSERMVEVEQIAIQHQAAVLVQATAGVGIVTDAPRPGQFEIGLAQARV